MIFISLLKVEKHPIYFSHFPDDIHIIIKGGKTSNIFQPLSG